MRNKKFSSLAAVLAAAIAVFSAVNFAQATTASHIVINEIFPNPIGDDKESEFVEITNIGESSVDVSGWKIIDETDHKKIFPENSIIESGEFLILEGNLYLNNDSDTVYLLDKNGERKDDALDHKYYEKARESFSYGFDGENWDWTLTPTPEAENVFDSPPEEESTEDSSNSDDKTDVPEKVYSKNLKITELLPNPSIDEDAGEFTEIYNADPEEIIELSGWRLEDKTGNSYYLPDISLKPEEYRAFYRNKSSLSLNNTGGETVFLKNPDGEIVNQISYSGTVKEDYAYALSNGSFSWTSTPTPGEKNVFDALSIEASIEASSDSDDSATTDANIFLNEILPNPKDGSDNEYIELANGSTESVDLFGWRIKDASKSKGYQFKEHIILNPSEFLAIYRTDSKVALNNSNESIYLYAPKNEIASSVSFDKSQKNSSYSFDGKIWRWTKYQTPGKKNKFDSEPTVKIKKPKKVYKDLIAEFSAKAKDKETKKLKYAWDFGDGKKSSLAKTSHKYLDTGKYTVTLSVQDDSQTVEKSFSLSVKKYPRPNIEIVKIVPNPAGNDSENEIIEIKNNSKNKIALAGWKIATGSGEKIYNHPINGDAFIKPGEAKTITRELSKFSLNNKSGRVALVMSDGKVIDEVEYSKEKISEGEIYIKLDDKWSWINSNAEKNKENDSEAAKSTDDESFENEDVEDGEVLGAANTNIPILAPKMNNYTSEDAYIFLSKTGFIRPNRELNYCPLRNTTASLEYILISSI